MQAPLSEQQIQLVQNSFADVMPIAGQAAELFYARLFELDPHVKSLFRGDMKQQGQRLMAMIAIAVRGLDNLATLAPALQDLGRRHVEYGVMAEHYDRVGAALLWTLQQGLGEAFTPAVRDAWRAVYALLADTMLSATRTAESITATQSLPSV